MTASDTLHALDHDLVVRARGGDRAAFRELYERFRAPVFTLLVPILRGNRALAEDALQETFLRVHAKLDSWDATRAFRPWLFRITRNVAIDVSRTERKEQRLAEKGAPRAADEGPHGAAVRREENDHARAALDKLPEEVRVLLVQRHVGDLTLPELAECWECSERTIVSRLREAAALLAQAIAMERRRVRT